MVLFCPVSESTAKSASPTRWRMELHFSGVMEPLTLSATTVVFPWVLYWASPRVEGSSSEHIGTFGLMVALFERYVRHAMAMILDAIIRVFVMFEISCGTATTWSTSATRKSAVISKILLDFDSARWVT